MDQDLGQMIDSDSDQLIITLQYPKRLRSIIKHVDDSHCAVFRESVARHIVKHLRNDSPTRQTYWYRVERAAKGCYLQVPMSRLDLEATKTQLKAAEFSGSQRGAGPREQMCRIIEDILARTVGLPGWDRIITDETTADAITALFKIPGCEGQEDRNGGDSEEEPLSRGQQQRLDSQMKQMEPDQQPTGNKRQLSPDDDGSTDTDSNDTLSAAPTTRAALAKRARMNTTRSAQSITTDVPMQQQEATKQLPSRSPAVNADDGPRSGQRNNNQTDWREQMTAAKRAGAKEKQEKEEAIRERRRQVREDLDRRQAQNNADEAEELKTVNNEYFGWV